MEALLHDLVHGWAGGLMTWREGNEKEEEDVNGEKRGRRINREGTEMILEIARVVSCWK